MQPIFVEILPIKLTNNNDGRGHSWYRSSVERRKIGRAIGHMRRKPFGFRVDLRITRILGVKQLLWDADSIGRGNAKELVDTLVALGWFHDDGPKYIRHCDYRQDDSQRTNGPAVQVEVFEVTQ